MSILENAHYTIEERSMKAMAGPLMNVYRIQRVPFAQLDKDDQAFVMKELHSFYDAVVGAAAHFSCVYGAGTEFVEAILSEGFMDFTSYVVGCFNNNEMIDLPTKYDLDGFVSIADEIDKDCRSAKTQIDARLEAKEIETEQHNILTQENQDRYIVGYAKVLTSPGLIVGSLISDMINTALLLCSQELQAIVAAETKEKEAQERSENPENTGDV
jgi:hypothetical protein